jgi:hypothetical protein
MIFCRLDPKYTHTKALCSILRDIYDKATNYMEFHGKGGTCLLSNNNKYTKPSGIINESNTANHLKYPIWYKETSTINSQRIKVISKDTTSPFTVVLSVPLVGEYATKFYDDDTIFETRKLIGCCIEHIPIMRVSSVHVKNKSGGIRLIADSSFVVSKIPISLTRYD